MGLPIVNRIVMSTAKAMLLLHFDYGLQPNKLYAWPIGTKHIIFLVVCSQWTAKNTKNQNTHTNVSCWMLVLTIWHESLYAVWTKYFMLNISVYIKQSFLECLQIRLVENRPFDILVNKWNLYPNGYTYNSDIARACYVMLLFVLASSVRISSEKLYEKQAVQR